MPFSEEEVSTTPVLDLTRKTNPGICTAYTRHTLGPDTINTVTVLVPTALLSATLNFNRPLMKSLIEKGAEVESTLKHIVGNPQYEYEKVYIFSILRENLIMLPEPSEPYNSQMTLEVFIHNQSVQLSRQRSQSAP